MESVNNEDRFLNIEWIEGDCRRWRQPLVPGLTGGRGHLFGGCGLGAAIAGLERATGRPLVWITAQFLAASRPPDVLDFTVDRLIEGRNLTQATVVARVGGTEVLTFQAALGARPALADELRFAAAPDVPGPDHCEPVVPLEGTGWLRRRFDSRVVPPGAGGPDGPGGRRPGSSLWWFRVADGVINGGADGVVDQSGGADAGAPSLLAVVLDFVPMALTAVLGRPVFGSSLDNTVRVVDRAPTDWVLAEFTIDSVAQGIAHVGGRVWTRDGVLLATGSQTCVVTGRPPA